MEKFLALLPFHEHPLVPFTRFDFTKCKGCYSSDEDNTRFIFQQPGCSYIYGGYRCNEPGCDVVFHEECAKPLPEINHPYHPDHPLELILLATRVSTCSFCGEYFSVGYRCSICHFELDLICARRPAPLVLAENSYLHEHPLQLSHEAHETLRDCRGCGHPHKSWKHFYRCHQCEFFISLDCVDQNIPEAYHTSHSQHPLKSLRYEVPGYADKKCLLCGEEFDGFRRQLHHCGVCNFSICRGCMKNPPPLGVLIPRTHEHQLHLVPRRIDFTCNACGTLGDRSPYFCLQCNFMIHRECIDLPRIININRHDHRISYTPRLGHGEWKCRVCRKKVDGFYGAYSCSKCSNYFVHSRCATSRDVWDMIELEGTPEEEEIAPFEVIDDNTIRHYSHNHKLRINKDVPILHENIVCCACIFQICSEPFYSCKRCNFILHEKCANLPLKKRHACHNQPFRLVPSFRFYFLHWCSICRQQFTGFRYESDGLTLDVRCGSVSEPFEHKSHRHPLYLSTDHFKRCSECEAGGELSCDECEFGLCFKCALLPQKVMRHRYDDHPLFLSYGERSVDGEYWCEACETKVNPEKWFYTCNDCGITLHISCVIGSYSYTMPGTLTFTKGKIVSNSSICRPLCCVCNSRCKLPFILKLPKGGVDIYFCSLECENKTDEACFQF